MNHPLQASESVLTALRPSGILEVSVSRLDPAPVFQALRCAHASYSASGLPSVGLLVKDEAAPVSSKSLQSVITAIKRAGFDFKGLFAETSGADILARTLSISVIETSGSPTASSAAVPRDTPAAPKSRPSHPLSSSRRRISRFMEPISAPPAAENSMPSVECPEDNGLHSHNEVSEKCPPAVSVSDASLSEQRVEPESLNGVQSDLPLLNEADKNYKVEPLLGAMIYAGHVRSGEQIHAQGRDLIVSGSVEKGAEVSADGSVHIYGDLCGSVAAGVSGNDQARIYALNFHATLISVAGDYTDLTVHPCAELDGCAVEIWRASDGLRVSPLGQPPK